MEGVCEKILDFKDTCIWQGGDNLWQQLPTCVVVERKKEMFNLH
jgi:hypothetical protein